MRVLTAEHSGHWLLVVQSLCALCTKLFDACKQLDQRFAAVMSVLCYCSANFDGSSRHLRLYHCNQLRAYKCHMSPRHATKVSCPFCLLSNEETLFRQFVRIRMVCTACRPKPKCIAQGNLSKHMTRECRCCKWLIAWLQLWRHWRWSSL